jgi:hypothetical protein
MAGRECDILPVEMFMELISHRVDNLKRVKRHNSYNIYEGNLIGSSEPIRIRYKTSSVDFVWHNRIRSVDIRIWCINYSYDAAGYFQLLDKTSGDGEYKPIFSGLAVSLYFAFRDAFNYLKR